MIVPLKGISMGARKPTFEAEGFTGTSCQLATAAFQKALGATTDEELKSEFYEMEQQHETLNN